MIKQALVAVAFVLLVTGCRSSLLVDPATTIQFTVPQSSHVTLEIENSYNTVIAVPVDGDRAPGTYSVVINSSTWLEGVYYYTLECRGINSDYYYKVTKTMLLRK